MEVSPREEPSVEVVAAAPCELHAEVLAALGHGKFCGPKCPTQDTGTEIIRNQLVMVKHLSGSRCTPLCLERGGRGFDEPTDDLHPAGEGVGAWLLPPTNWSQGSQRSKRTGPIIALVGDLEET